MNISLNPNLAKAGSGGSSRIDSKGKYIGTIEWARVYSIPTGSTWVEFKFVSLLEQEAKVSLCILNKDGEATYGLKKLQAMMACCKIRELTQTNMTVNIWNFDTSQMEDTEQVVYKEFCGANIGLLLYRHDKTSNSGNDFFQMELEAPFAADTEQTAAEVLDQMPAKQLEKMVQTLRDKDDRTSGNASSDFYQQASGQQDNFCDDSIPF
tara:strand:- start:3468 stop:4094 length:627 start_codon:yes stop_codon:yes gene_type:complete